jgi:hypothetical protein
VPTETHADCNKKYNLIYYTVKLRAVLTFLVCPSGGLYTKLNERIQYKWSSTFIGLCLQYWSVFPVCADWLLLIDLWHPNWRAARNHHRDPCRLSFPQRACSQASSDRSAMACQQVRYKLLWQSCSNAVFNRPVASCWHRAAAMLFLTGLSQVVDTELQQCCFQQACRK